jgi:hypothetical protein
MDSSKPQLLKGGASDWPACQRWSPEYFANKYGDTRVDAVVSETGSIRYRPDGIAENPQKQFVAENIELREAANWIVKGRCDGAKTYVAYQSIPHILPELLLDLKLTTPLGGVNLWFGSSGNLTPLHYDNAENHFVQIYGEKTFVLFPPDQSEFLYPNSAGTTLAHLSRIDVDSPDYTIYPQFLLAKPLIFKLTAGDILVFPAKWWHYVRSTTISISVNHWLK